jgi:hypothetical protein
MLNEVIQHSSFNIQHST